MKRPTVEKHNLRCGCNFGRNGCSSRCRSRRTRIIWKYSKCFHYSLFLFSTSDPLIFRFNGNTYYSFFLSNGSIRVYETQKDADVAYDSSILPSGTAPTHENLPEEVYTWNRCALMSLATVFCQLVQTEQTLGTPSLIAELPSESLLSLFESVSDHKKARGFLLLFLESG